ncbi:PH domain-containing protein [Streptomyces antibioticus]|uniref:PH domain-containing protein n=1 Tax=Streptomyces antibioticus TaxID=1890 RepID=UPI0036B1DA69
MEFVIGEKLGGATEPLRTARNGAMAYTEDQTALRRPSWPVLHGIVIIGLGIGMLAAVCKVTSASGFRSGWQGIPVFLALAGICGRVARCRVELRQDTLLVINPLRTHIVPRVAIRSVSVGDDGTLEVQLDEDQKISVFAFGGSLLDRVRDTSGEAERKITGWLHATRPVDEPEAPPPQVRWTRCRSADASLALSVVVSGAGALWMALSGG